MHRKRLAVALAATLALSTIAAACGDDDSGDNADKKTTTTAAKGETTTTATPATPAADNGGRKDASGPLKLGEILPQTGKLSSIGPPMIKGVAMAIRDINAAGGVNGADVQLIEKDDGGGTTNDIAKQSVDVLINNDKVNAIIGP